MTKVFSLVIFLSIAIETQPATIGEKSVKCSSAIIRLTADPPNLVALLEGGSLAIYDTSGVLLHTLSLDLNLPDLSKIQSRQTDRIVFVEGTFDFVRYFPKEQRVVVFRDNYTKYASLLWEFLTNGIKHSLGWGSKIEVWDCKNKTKVYERQVLGKSGPKSIDLISRYLAYACAAGNKENLFVVDLQSERVSWSKDVRYSHETRVFGDTAYLISYDYVYKYKIDNNGEIKNKMRFTFNCRLLQFYLFQTMTENQLMSIAYNGCVDTTVGPFRFIADRNMYLLSNEIINFTPHSEGDFYFPLGYLNQSDELLLRTHQDTLYLLNYSNRSMRKQALFELVDTSSYTDIHPLFNGWFYAMNELGEKGDSVFALFKLNI